MKSIRLFKLGMGLTLIALSVLLVRHNLQREQDVAGVPLQALQEPVHPSMQGEGPVPSPHLSPRQVVQIQLAAMGGNEPPANQGLALAWRFAAPRNRQSIGQLEDFVRVVNSPTYKPMLEYESVVYGPLVAQRFRAEQLVTLTMPDGDTVSYVFLLGLQDSPSVFQCWMTEGVIPVDPASIPPPAGPPASPAPNQPGGQPGGQPGTPI